MSKEIVNKKTAIKMLSRLGSEFVIVDNPSYINPNYDIFPLSKKLRDPLSKMIASVMDMDGTTTTTEVLCIHSLEFMIRKFSGFLTPQQWRGLDHEKDFPNVIGNSTTKHVEYLIKTYGKIINNDFVIQSFIQAAVWTLLFGKDEGRKREVIDNLSAFNLSSLHNEISLKLKDNLSISLNEFDSIIKKAQRKYSKLIVIRGESDLVRIGIDVYYQRYHEILERIRNGEAKQISNELNLEIGKHLIEPMPAIGVFLALVKGLLGKDASKFVDYLVQIKKKSSSKNIDKSKLENHLALLGEHFQKYPMKVAIVTSSIKYEADIVLSEVFKVLTNEVDNWNISKSKKIKIKNHFTAFDKFYEAIITATDSSEIRLKPHRDLYSLALYRLSIPVKDFNKVIGFEDSESGLIAMRAAGIGNCVAVPFAQTSGHNFQAASIIAKNGVVDILTKS
ncbi:MAG: hypothetical protein KF721_15425 [Ignavibacteriaceae bacterium]|nr:hypothetical protein [Ignavibacteriaceae bacterium]